MLLLVLCLKYVDQKKRLEKMLADIFKRNRYVIISSKNMSNLVVYFSRNNDEVKIATRLPNGVLEASVLYRSLGDGILVIGKTFLQE